MTTVDPSAPRRLPRLRALGLMTASSAVVLTGGLPSAHATGTTVASWPMDETSGSTMIDASGNGIDGTTYNVELTGSTGYRFDGATSKVIVPNSALLDPGESDFSWTVVVQSEHTPAAGTDMDLLRKGIGSSTGGEYKSEIVAAKGQGRGFCLVKDSAGVSATIKGVSNITDGLPHTVTCTKTATSLTLQVDDLKPRVKVTTSPIGSISNTRSLVLGVKSATVTGSAGDWYQGAMLEASVSIG